MPHKSRPGVGAEFNPLDHKKKERRPQQQQQQVVTNLSGWMDWGGYTFLLQ
jgi:hypothetical protein